MPIGRLLAVLGGCAVVAAPFVAHAAIATGRFTGIATVLGLAQAATLGVMAARQAKGLVRVVGVALALALLATRLLWPNPVDILGLIATSGVSHAIIYSSLFLLFAHSLRPGRTALVTGLALRMRGSLKPAMLSYTRIVTKAWCAFFLGELVLSAALLAFAPYRVWSLFINVLDGPMVIALFAVEYGIRRWRFRHERHESPLAAAFAFSRTRVGG